MLFPPQGIQDLDGIAAAAFPLLGGNGGITAPTYSFSTSSNSGMHLSGGGDAVNISVAGVARLRIGTGTLYVPAGNTIGFSSNADVDAALPDVSLARDAAAVLALKNGTTAQTFRVYGSTTGPKYLEVTHNGTNGQVNSQSGGLSLYSSGASWDIGSGGGLVAGVVNQRFSHGVSALATDATEGFFHMNSCAGAATGTPASIPSGQIPMVYDTTNHRLYIYEGGAWHYIARTA